MDRFEFADLHCHPNLKTFGQSFSRKYDEKINVSHVWFQKRPSYLKKLLNTLLGITKFSQTDFSTMAEANVKIAFVSYYPFEKGFFINDKIYNVISAQLASLVTSIGYKRVRHIQKHLDYFADLNDENSFFSSSCKEFMIGRNKFSWDFVKDYQALLSMLEEEHQIAVIPTIEGAHVLNSGLERFGKTVDEDEVLHNVSLLKKWNYPPLFITFAHNFYNDFCGHAVSLEPLGKFVDQKPGLGDGITNLGLKVIDVLLNDKPIFIDIKHMSIKSRKEYYKLMSQTYQWKIPIIVSHGAVTGRDWNGATKGTIDSSFFCNDDINFYDEDLVSIARSHGLFAVQLDANRLTPKKFADKSIQRIDHPDAVKNSAAIIWRQIQHIAEVLDHNNLPSWNIACIGSDFDGTINPLNGLWTSAQLPVLANHLLKISNDFLKSNNSLSNIENRSIAPEEIVHNFTIKNALSFLKKNYTI